MCVFAEHRHQRPCASVRADIPHHALATMTARWGDRANFFHRAEHDPRDDSAASLDAPRPVDVLCRIVILHRLVALALIVVALGLAPVAHATPPDPSWIPGLYDNADFDDVILLITSKLGAIQSNIIPSLRPVAFVLGLATPMPTESRPLRPLSSVFGRAPPLA